MSDLGYQVTVLLREVESARFGGRPMPVGVDDDLGMAVDRDDADAIITRRLVTFKDVRELQQRNAELLTVIREISAKQVQIFCNFNFQNG